MSKCMHCGLPHDEKMKYCPWCGAAIGSISPKPGEAVPLRKLSKTPEKPRFCGGCGAILPYGCPSCLVCGLKSGEPPPPAPEFIPEALSGYGKNGAVAQKSHNDIAVFCVIICVISLGSTILLWALNALPIFSTGSRYVLTDAVIYQTTGEKLKMMSPLLDVPLEIVDGFHSVQRDLDRPLVKSSPNNRYIAYVNGYAGNRPDAHGSLYLLDFAGVSPTELSSPVETPVSTGVTDSFFFMDNGGTLVFLTSDGELCATDYSEIVVLDTEVASVIENSDSKILYAKSLESRAKEAFSLYLMDTNDRVITFIDTDVSEVADYTQALNRMIYIQEISDGNRTVMTYNLDTGDNGVLAAGIDRLISCDAATFSAVYQTASRNSLSYDSLILDDHLLPDKALSAPDLDDFPLLIEYYDIYGIDPKEVEALEQDEDLAEQKAALDAVIEAYDAKLRRDRLRDGIGAEILAFTLENPVLYDLHVSSGGVSTRLAENSYTPFDDAVFDPSTGTAVFRAAGFQDSRKIPITSYERIVSGISLREYLTHNISDMLFVYHYNGGVLPLHIGDGAYYSGGFALTAKADGIYFAMGNGSPIADFYDNMCILYYAPLSGASPVNIMMVDERVAGVGEMLDGDRLIYYKDREQEICDLYIMNGSTSERIGSGVSLSPDFFMILNGNKTLLYCERFDAVRKTGDLFMLTRQTRQIAGGVTRIHYKNDGLIYFLRGGHNSGLYAFKSNGLFSIDNNVIAVVNE
ncbi:MAG: zinc ribbon domain-containing protein [Oscillospiraceae bacterium]|nr:zinc ribbon domain-containing protein [Oscillospiraceae bacterium]